MTRDEMLQRLQPPVMPAEPGFWPPAMVWWLLLAAICVAGISWLLWRLHQHRNRHFYQARQSLNDIGESFKAHKDSAKLLLQLAYWLRQVVRISDTNAQSTTLHGTDWLALLDQDLKQPAFSQGPGRVFGDQMYQVNADIDSAAVLALCHHWLEASRKRLNNHDRF